MRLQRCIRSLTLATLFCLPLAPFCPAKAQETSPPVTAPKEDPKTADLRKQIQGYYTAMDDATGRLSMEGSFKYVAPDCKVILRDGSKVNLKNLKEIWQMVYRRAIKSQMKSVVTRFSTKGDTATVELHSEVYLRVRNDNGIENDLEWVSDTRDFWVKTKGKWQIKQTREMDRTTKMNGQIIEE